MSTRQRGAALLAAMLTVTLVATFAAAALWQQWRSIEVETAERARVQSAWILLGALDWSRLILIEDSRAGGADHLAEPWAVPLEEARLSTRGPRLARARPSHRGLPGHRRPDLRRHHRPAVTPEPDQPGPGRYGE